MSIMVVNLWNAWTLSPAIRPNPEANLNWEAIVMEPQRPEWWLFDGRLGSTLYVDQDRTVYQLPGGLESQCIMVLCIISQTRNGWKKYW